MAFSEVLDRLSELAMSALRTAMDPVTDKLWTQGSVHTKEDIKLHILLEGWIIWT